MSIQKKSLISALKTSKKAKIASAPVTEVESGKSQKNLMRFVKAAPGTKLSRMVRLVRFARVD
jgi:hypothetical protein